MGIEENKTAIWSIHTGQGGLQYVQRTRKRSEVLLGKEKKLHKLSERMLTGTSGFIEELASFLVNASGVST